MGRREDVRFTQEADDGQQHTAHSTDRAPAFVGRLQKQKVSEVNCSNVFYLATGRVIARRVQNGDADTAVLKFAKFTGKTATKNALTS